MDRVRHWQSCCSVCWSRFFISVANGTGFDNYYFSGTLNNNNCNFFVGDVDGDGHSDIITTDKSSPETTGYRVFRTGGNSSALMEKVGNGLGELTKVSYLKLSKANSSYYQRGSGAVYPLTDFQGPLSVVSSFQVDNGKGSLNLMEYFYEGAKIHLRGKGFLGFFKTRLTDHTAGIANEAIIPDGFNPTYFYPSVQLTLSKRAGTNDTISKVKNVLSQVVLNASKKWIFPYVSSSKVTNKLTGHTVTVNTSGYDNYGNPSTVVKTYSNGPTETTTTTYDNTVSSTQWLLGRPTSASIQYTGGGNTITRTVTRSFSPVTNNLNSETWYSGTANQYAKGYKYNTNGTLKRDSVTAAGVSRTTIYTYESNGVRVKTITDPLSHTTTNTYDARGRLQAVKDYLNNTLSYQYDEMGRVTNVSSSDGNQTSSVYAWESPASTPKPARYSVIVTVNDGSQTKKWFDKLSREIRSDVKGFDGSWIYTDTRYNKKGQVDSISEAYYTGPTWNRYQYDNYGRKISLTRPSGRNSSWIYTTNTVTETTGGRSFSKTYSSDGTVSSATDAGGTIIYTYYPDGKIKTITAPGNIVTQMQYDIAGNQTKLIDPSAGTITYIYNGFGELLTQQNSRMQTTTITYYPDGRIARKVTPEGTIKYRYNANKQLTNIGSPGGVSRSFAYDSKGRPATITDTIPGTTPLIKTLTYDGYGRPGTITHPSNIVETRNYNSNGYLSSVSAGGSARWTVTSMNALQQIKGGRYGTSLNAAYGYDSHGYLTSNTTGSLQNYTYSFNTVTGNLNWRKNVLQANIQENFEYDNLDRLGRVYRGSTTLLDMAYDSNKGGITTKSDVGTLNYNISAKPYALGTVNPSTGLLPTAIDSLTYTSFEKVNTISEGNFAAYFTYNGDNERAKMEVKQSGSTILARWYPSGSYIKETQGGVTKEYTFIGGDAYTAPVVAITQGGTTTYYNLLRDHLGSITHVVNASNNTLLYEYSYDAWGRMRNVSSWTNYAPGSEPALFVAGRGFTGHEHLPWFNLINMNGRLYDPLVGQFLSPDNYVQSPDFTQNFNRYSYCFNNPLKLADPSGERTILGRFFNWVGEQGAKPWVRALISMPTMLSIAPGEVLTMDAMSGGGFVTNFVQGGFSKGFQGVGNYFKVSGQMFDTGTETKGWGWRLLSRFTREGLNTGMGNIAATLANSSGVVDDVQYYRGATVLKTRGYWGAITFGNNIIGDRNIEALPDNYLFQHEYGHYLRSRESGPGYYFEYGIPSLWYAAWHTPEEHKYYWIERDANNAAFIYFTEQYPGFGDWFYKRNPLYDEGDPRNNSYPVFKYGHPDRPSTFTINKH